jgi:hypothetical protein
METLILETIKITVMRRNTLFNNSDNIKHKHYSSLKS